MVNLFEIMVIILFIGVYGSLYYNYHSINSLIKRITALETELKNIKKQ